MTITRRLFLRNTAAASAAVATATIPAAAEVAFPSPRKRLEAAIVEVKAAASDLWPDIGSWTEMAIPSDEESPYNCCPIVLVSHKPSLPLYLEWSGPGVYEIEQGKSRPIYFVDRVFSKTDGLWLYRGCHWWNGKKDGPFVYFGASEPLRIVRKIEEMSL